MKSTGDVRRELGLSNRQFYYLLEIQPDLRPERLMAGNFLWTDAEVEAIRQARAALVARAR